MDTKMKKIMLTVRAEAYEYAEWFIEHGHKLISEDLKDYSDELEEFTEALRKQAQESQGKPWAIDTRKLKILHTKDLLVLQMLYSLKEKLAHAFGEHASMFYYLQPDCVTYSKEYPEGLLDYTKARKQMRIAEESVKKIMEDPNKRVETLKYRFNSEDNTYYPENYFEEKVAEDDGKR